MKRKKYDEKRHSYKNGESRQKKKMVLDQEKSKGVRRLHLQSLNILFTYCREKNGQEELI